ncbi:hypothetical protein VTK73DRAFT_6580 [Phialemonium thermophilum]|uniref:F-box domain-containing protein n=1 Tax=Phialemonium thermophilum TaxID=223376 RepID=A0ABR3WJ68_9PEZI
MAGRIIPINDWAPAQQAIYDETPSSGHDSCFQRRESVGAALPKEKRSRSVSVSLLFRHRPRSSVFHIDDDAASRSRPLALSKSKSHQELHAAGTAARDSARTTSDASKFEPPLTFRRFIRRASLSVKSGVMGMINRRTSVPAPITLEDHEQAPFRHRRLTSSHATSRPTTAHSTWHRLRQAASFHRQSRVLHTGHDGHDDCAYGLEAIESPTFPVPGSGEQPPIIPRNTGAAARLAAANAHNSFHEPGFLVPPSLGRSGYPADEGLNDYESGIGIALTSSEVELYVPSTEVDSDVDVGVEGAGDDPDISKIDFVSRLPVELAVQVLSYLDAQALAAASRVSRTWNWVVSNQHVWRESFLREKTGTYATSGPVKPGTGLGIPTVQPSNNWKEIYRVKEELDRRWKEGKVRPVYLNGHSDSIYCLQFDEFKIVTGSRDKTIRVWDMHTFACKLVIGPPDVVNDPALSLLYDEDGNPVHYATLPESDASPSANDGQARPSTRTYPSTPALVSFPMHHNASILCLQYDDQILVTGSSDSTCIVYNIRSGYRPVRRLRHHTAAVLDLVFDDKHIVTCSKDVSICVWDRETGNLIRQLRGHSGPVNAVQMRGNTIVSCSGDFRVKLWNIDTGKNIREFSGHTKGLACSQFSEDGRYVASAGNDRVIRVWDANTGECVREIRAHQNLVRSLHVDSVSGRLVSGSYDTDIKVFDMETGRQILDFPRWHNSWVLSAKSDYRRIVSTGQEPKILIMDFGAGVRGIEMLETRPAGKQQGIVEGEYI